MSTQTTMKQLYIFLIAVLLLSTSAIYWGENTTVPAAKKALDVEAMTVEDALLMLGDDTMIHYMSNVDPKLVAVGEELIFNGWTTRDGKKTDRISHYFVCTDCHSVSREFEDISSQSPEDRLNYAKEQRMAFLPGSTFWGIYNRTSFYNKDYIKKYGDLVLNARDSLENAIQVCAKYCSSGRHLEDWELEAIMHYYKSLELKVKDLSLSENDLKNLRKYGQLKPEERKELIQKMKDSYVQGYDATFLETMPREERRYGEGGDVANGEFIYEASCLNCHANGRLTYLILGKNKLDARMFWRNRKNYKDKSLYQIVRHGTFSKPGRRQYMPLYTKEKMSDEQLNDLMAYIKKLAEK